MGVVSDEPPWFFTHVFPWGFIVAGSGFTFDALTEIVRARASHRWPIAQGTVTKSCVVGTEVSADSAATIHVPTLEYAYSVDGKKLKGKRITAADAWGGNKEQASATLKRLPQGAKVDVRYCPSDPQISLLVPGIRPRLFVKLVFALLTLALGIGMLLFFPMLKYFEHGGV